MDESNQKNTNKHQIHNFRRLTILRKRKMQQRSQAEQSLTTQELPSFVAIRLVHFISAIVLVCAITAGIIQTHRYWIPVVKQIINPAQEANQNDCPVPAPKNSIHNDAASMRELDHRMFKQIKKENSDFSDKRETRLKEEGILLSAVDSAMQPVEDRDEEQLETLTAFIGDSTVNANELNATGLFEEELEESSKIHAVLPNTIIGTTDETAKEIKTFKSDDTSQYMESTKIENKEAPIVVKSQKELPSDEQDCESCEKLLEVPDNRNSSSDSNKVTETYIKSSSEIVTDSTIIKEDAVALPITDDPGLLIVEDSREIEPSSKDPSNIEEMPAKDNGDLRSEDKDLREYEPIISVENDKDASVIPKRPPIESIKAENHTPTVLESTASRNIPVHIEKDDAQSSPSEPPQPVPKSDSRVMSEFRESDEDIQKFMESSDRQKELKDLLEEDIDLDSIAYWIHTEIEEQVRLKELENQLSALLKDYNSPKYVKALAVNTLLEDIKSAEQDDDVDLARSARMGYSQLLEIGHRLEFDHKTQQTIFRNLVDICIRQAWYKDAIDYADRLLEMKPNDTEIMSELGTLLTYEGESERAIRIFKQIIDANAADDEDRNFAYLNLGMLTLHTYRDFKTAANYFLKGLKLNTDPAEARFYAYATEALIRIGKLNEALVINKKAADQGILISPYQLSASTIPKMRNNRFWTIEETGYDKDFNVLESTLKSILMKPDVLISSIEPYFSPDDSYNMERGNAEIIPLIVDGDMSDVCKDITNTTSMLEKLCSNLGSFSPLRNCRVCDAMMLKMSENSKYWPRSGVSNFRLRALRPIIGSMEIEMIEDVNVNSSQTVVDNQWQLFDDSFLHSLINGNNGSIYALVADMWHPDLSKEDMSSISRM